MVVRFGTVGLVVRFRLLGVVRVCVLCRRGRDEGEQSNGAVVWPHMSASCTNTCLASSCGVRAGGARKRWKATIHRMGRVPRRTRRRAAAARAHLGRPPRRWGCLDARRVGSKNGEPAAGACALRCRLLERAGSAAAGSTTAKADDEMKAAHTCISCPSLRPTSSTHSLDIVTTRVRCVSRCHVC